MKRFKLFLIVVLVVGLIGINGIAFAKEYRFVIVPKVVHPWFDLVVEGARAQAKLLEEQTGDTIIIDYRAPSRGEVVLQNNILEQAAVTRPDGIAVDLLDEAGNKVVLESIVNMGIPVVIFDSESPEGMNLTKIGNDFAEQAQIASERLVELLGGKGKVAIMQGVPTAPNHRIRYEAHKAVFDKYPGIELVAEGIDNDDIQTAQEQAAAIIAAHPDIDGFVACDAAGPIGIGLAVKEAGRAGDIQVVGLDNLNQLIELIREGVVDSSSSTKPQMQGAYSVLMLWQRALGMDTPKEIDTGIEIITKENLEELGY
jgi:ribose transport system substrate-binding protein